MIDILFYMLSFTGAVFVGYNLKLISYHTGRMSGFKDFENIRDKYNDDKDRLDPMGLYIQGYKNGTDCNWFGMTGRIRKLRERIGR